MPLGCGVVTLWSSVNRSRNSLVQTSAIAAFHGSSRHVSASYAVLYAVHHNQFAITPKMFCWYMASGGDELRPP